ncbi:MAG: hypothetical protein GXO29_07505, partial [Thermotogae bacterium]|nr:hypothetical protein [Thermotogota bacterium]
MALFASGEVMCDRLLPKFPESKCECTPCDIGAKHAIARGVYLEVLWCSPDSHTYVVDTFKDVKTAISIDAGTCGATVLQEPLVADTTVCLADTCAHIVGLDVFRPIHLYSADDSLPPDEGFYLKVVRIDTSVYLIGMDVGGRRMHISPDLHADIAPDTGGYADTVLAVVSTDPS